MIIRQIVMALVLLLFAYELVWARWIEVLVFGY